MPAGCACEVCEVVSVRVTSGVRVRGTPFAREGPGAELAERPGSHVSFVFQLHAGHERLPPFLFVCFR